MTVVDRFLQYVKFDTQSDELTNMTPSTPGQMIFAQHLEKELKSMGLKDISLDENGYLMATLPGNTDAEVPTIGFIAHLDTSPDMSGHHVTPRIVKDYDGNDITLNQADGIILSPTQFPELLDYKGQDLIVTDGRTLLGADDKAGIAIIMQALEEIIRDDAPHGRIAVAFTPDEEIGRGVDHFDLSLFPVEYAYTVDGDRIDAVDYETFNAAQATVSIQGTSIHPGDAKDRMVNAALLAVEFASMLPEDQTPAKTEGREGFYHLVSMEGECESATLTYILREHDAEKFEKQIETIERVRDTLNEKYGDRIEVAVRRQYANMKDYMKGDMRAVERARKAIEKAGLEPVSIAVRGGTDGAMLTQRGLICPNLGTGSYNHHGRFEFASVQQMDRMVRIVRDIVEGE